MNKATDPLTGLSVRPNPGARAVCPYCRAEMAAKCGEIIDWHWAHIGPTCQEWEAHPGEPGESKPNNAAPKRICEMGCYFFDAGRCHSAGPQARAWFAAWFGSNDLCAPQCPAFRVVSTAGMTYLERMLNPTPGTRLWHRMMARQHE